MTEPVLPASACFAAGRVGYAIGDIHGRLDLLMRLVAQIEADAIANPPKIGPPVAIFLGDYVDRGRDSFGVIAFLLTCLPGFERRFLRGNHEQVMRAFLDDPLTNRGWLAHGGVDTLVSYDVRPALSDADDAALELVAEAFAEAIPQTHLAFLDRLERYVTYGDYVFVHAGVDHAKPLEHQTDQDLYWSRDRFLKSTAPFGHRVVHGHTPADRPFVGRHRIGVDTGAYATGVLTAVRLEGQAVDFLTSSPARPARA